MEIWKDIEGYEGSYQVSNKGRVKSLKGNQEKILNTLPHPAGYHSTRFYQKGVRKSFTIHRLVATAFIANPENKPCVNHINGIKTDNRDVNLEWCTYKENQLHASDNELRFTKLTENEVLEIREKYESGNFTYVELGITYEVDPTCIGKIVRRETWRRI